ncbi:MAG: protein kinase [Planctomycetes bacterium]|nr:protein kinase [Planctomycetota bacterium]
MRSPKVKGRVSPEWQSLIDQCLGCNGHRRPASAQGFVELFMRFESTQSDSDVVVGADTDPNVAEILSVGPRSVLKVQTTRTDRDGAGLPFTRLGHYEVIDRIGHGGMGDVYRGYERALDRTVALKVLPAELSKEPEFVHRFSAEAAAAARVVHPNVIQIHFIGEDSGHHFFAMQYVDGESLAAILARRGKLNVTETLQVLEQVLAGLAAAHRQGLIHRDIKPGNILLDRLHQRALLADFGLVKSLSAMEGQTATGVIMGSVDYIAPEQGRGQWVDHRSDLYSLGVLAYQMLSGRLPFAGESPTAVIYQHVYEVVPPLDEDIPRSLAAVIAKLMAKSRGQRHASADEVLADLQAFRSGAPLPSAADVELAADKQAFMKPEPASDPTVSSRIVRAPLFADDVWLAEAPITDPPSTWLSRLQNWWSDCILARTPEWVAQLQSTQHQMDGAVLEYERRRNQLRCVVYEGEQVLATIRSALAIKSDDADLQRALADQDEQLGEIRLRLSKVEISLRHLCSQRDLLQARLKAAYAKTRVGGIRSHRVPIRQVQIIVASLAVIAIVGLLKLADYLPVSTRIQTLDKINFPVVETLPDRARYEELFIVPPTSFGVPFEGINKNVIDLEVGPGGKLIAAVTGDKDVFLWDVETGKRLSGPARELSRVNAVALNSDDSLLATGESSSPDNSTIKIWDTRLGELVGQVAGETKYVTDLEFQPGGSLLAACFLSAGIGQVDVWDYVAQSMHWELHLPETSISDIEFSPDGKLLVVQNYNHQLIVANLADQTIRVLPTSQERISQFAFLGDASRGVVRERDDSISIINVANGEQISKLESGLQGMRSMTVTHDGRWIAMTNGHWISVVDALSGTPRAVIPGHQTSHLGFSQSGDRLISAGGAPFLTQSLTRFAPMVARGPVKTVVYSPVLAIATRKPLAVLNSPGNISVWNYDQQSAPLSIKVNHLSDPANSTAAITPDGHRVAICDPAGVVTVADLLSGKQILQTHVPMTELPPQKSFLEHSDDSSTIWLGTCSGIWRIEPGKRSPEQWMEFSADTEAKSLSAGGRYAVTLKNQSWIQIWDVSKRSLIIEEQISDSKPFVFAFSRDMQWLVAADESQNLFRWNLARKGKSESFHIGKIDNLAFLPNAQILVATSGPKVIIIDVEHQESIAEFRLPNDRPLKDRIDQMSRIWTSHDGHFLITSDPQSDRILLWDFWPQHRLEGNR